MTSKISKLLKADSAFFTISTLQALFNITRNSARTTAARLVEKGILIRLRRDLYTLANQQYSLFALANALYQPSVISLETALNYYGAIVQVPQVIFSVSLVSHKCTSDETEFIYRRVDPSLFRLAQVKVENFFIAKPEKAFLDTLYMKSKGLAELLPEDVDMSKFDSELIDYYVCFYPPIVKKLLLLFRTVQYEAK